MKKLISYAAVLAVLFTVSACSKGGDDPYLTIDTPTTLTVSAEEAQALVKISSNIAWTISGGTDWCVPEVTSGTGDRTVKLVITPNAKRQPNSATLAVNSALGRMAINITQEGNTALNNYEEGEYRAVEINRQTNPVNIVIMGDGFIFDDLTKGGAYDQALDRAREAFFDIEPFRSYRNRFNVYYVYAESQQRGATYGYGYDGSTRNNFASTVRSTAFSAKFSQTDDSTSTQCNYQKVFNYARKVPAMKEGADIVLKEDGNIQSGGIVDQNNVINNSVIIVVINDQRYAGTCVMYPTGACIGMCPMSASPGTMSFEATLRHEVGGHGFGRFTDEYIYYNSELPQSSSNGGYNAATLAAWQGMGQYLNISLSDTPASAPDVWQPFLGNEAYPEVDFFEGACTYAQGVWRAEQNSIMNNNVRYFNGPQAYFIYNRIKKIAKETPTWDEFRSKDAARAAERVNASAASARGVAEGEKFIPLAPPIMMDMPR